MQQVKVLLKKTLYVMTGPQKILGIGVFFLTCIGAVLESLGVSVIIPFVTAIQTPEIIMDSSFVKNIDRLAALSYNQMIMLICIGVILLYLFKNIFSVFLSWVRVKFACKIEREMSVKMLASYLSHGYQFIIGMNYGEFSRGILGDPSAVYTVLSSVFRLLAEVFTILFICVFMFIADWKLATTVAGVSLLCLVIIYFVFRKGMYQAGIQARDYSAKTGQTVSQIFQGAKDVLLLRKQNHFIDEFEQDRIGTQNARCKQTVGSESPAYIIEGICVSGLMLAVGIRIAAGGNNTSFIAVLAAFAVGAFRILPSLGKISTSINGLINSVPSIEALYEQVVEAEKYARKHPENIIEIEEQSKYFGLISKGEKSKINRSRQNMKCPESKFQTAIELKNVSFQYEKELGDVLQNVNLTIKRGQSIAIIGESGAGKSTLVDVLLGLLVPQRGAIYMDGTPITEIPDKWANTIGYVPQTINLASTSLRKNIAFGEKEEDIDIDRVYEVLEKAELKDFIDSLPEGIETMAGDRGVRLSGGQRQRIAIARALYHRPEILVLDEATSALDNDTEAAIMSAINNLQGQVTMIIVAHRLTTVENCDLIYEVHQKGLRLCNKEEVLHKNREKKQ